MQFKDVVGQDIQKKRLIQEVLEGRVPHARLFNGQAGYGTLPMALAYASYLLCANPTQEDSCGKCSSCIQVKGMVHPDLHFAFPTIKSNSCDKFLVQWRELCSEMPYFNLPLWTEKIEAGNQQPVIYTAESDAIAQKLAFKSAVGGFKIMIIWQAERMNEQGANRLLKLIEEPPSKTIFILVTENEKAILPTIISRTQKVNFTPIDNKVLTTYLQEKYGLETQQAYIKARLSGGNFLKAVQSLQVTKEEQMFFDYFVQLMRLSYQKKIKELYAWSEELSRWGREKQKFFLLYAQRLLRENFIKNLQEKELTYLTEQEENFSKGFAPFINEYNIYGLMNELNKAQRDIEQNVHAQMVFFDFALKNIVLLMAKK